MSEPLECYCPYCGEVLEVDQGPGTYQCEECDSSFTLHEMLFSCPHCDETILLDDGPGDYRCDSCGGSLTLTKQNKVKKIGSPYACAKCGVSMRPSIFPYIGTMRCRDCGSRICRNCRSSYVCPVCKGRLLKIK